MGEDVKDDEWEAPKLQWSAEDRSLKEQSPYRCISKEGNHFHMFYSGLHINNFIKDILLCVLYYPPN